MNKIISYFLVLFIGLFGGYFWRLYQEVEHRDNSYERGKQFIIKAIRTERELGRVFFIEDLKFIPRKDRAINIKRWTSQK